MSSITSTGGETIKSDRDIAQLAKLDVDALLELHVQGAITGGELRDILAHQTALRKAREAQLEKDLEDKKKELQAERDKPKPEGESTKTVKEIVSTKPGWVTVRYSGRGWPLTGTVARFEAFLSYVQKNPGKVEALLASVRAVGDDEKAHKRLACYSAAKAKREEED